MSKNNNIENLFKESFGSFSAKPSEKVWLNVQKKVIPARLQYLFKSSFSNFTTTPGSSVWSKINARLIWLRFLYFNPLSFNVYYAAAILIIVAGFFTGIDLIDNISENRQSKITTGNQSQYSLANKRESLNIIYSDRINDNRVISGSSALIMEQTPTSQKLPYAMENESKGDKIIDEKAILEVASAAIPSEIESGKVSNENTLDYTVNPILNFGFSLLNYRPEPAYWMNLSFLNYQLRPPVKPDTLGYNYNGDPIIVDGSYISLEPGYNVFAGKTKLFSSNPEINPRINENILYHTDYSYSYGLNVALQEKHLRFVSGINYMKYNEIYHQPKTSQLVENSFGYEYYEYTDWVNDTAWILDLEAWIQGDTVYFGRVDSVLCNFSDSTLVMLSDTTYIFDTLTYSNQFTYVEIPLIGGYTFGTGKLMLTPQTGVILAFLNSASGKYPSSLEQSYAINNLYPLRQFTAKWYAGLNLRWYFANNFGVLAEPWFTADLLPLYSKNVDINRYNISYGIRLGISVRL